MNKIFYFQAKRNFIAFDYILKYTQHFEKIGYLRRYYIVDYLKNHKLMKLLPIMIWKRNIMSLGIFGFNMTINIIFFIFIFVPNEKILSIFKDKKITSVKTDVKFSDILGIEEFKEEIEQLVNFMNNRKEYIKRGAFLPKGVLLIGPPGCGKTQLARAVAGETNLPFYQISASEFLQPIMGESQNKIKKMFDHIRASKKGAILFIDEIDSIPMRSQLHTHVNSIMNQLLTEMDGFQKKDNIIIIAATNREKALDSALTRSGRFDYKIRIRLPYYNSRKEILQYYLNKIKFDKNLDIDAITRLTIGFSPADLKNLVNLAIINSINNQKYEACKEDFEYSFERIKLGIKSSKIFTNEEVLRVIAYKEATKAIIAQFDQQLPKPHKLSIIQYNQKSKGGSILLKNKDQTNQTKIELQKLIELYVSGKEMMKIFFPQIKNNLIIDDYKRGIEIAEKYLSEIAMDEDFSLISVEKKDMSEYMKKQTEMHLQMLLKKLGDNIKKFIIDNQNLISKVGEELLKKEVLTQKEFLQLIE